MEKFAAPPSNPVTSTGCDVMSGARWFEIRQSRLNPGRPPVAANGVGVAKASGDIERARYLSVECTLSLLNPAQRKDHCQSVSLAGVATSSFYHEMQ